MILVDTSVSVDHLCARNATLAELLLADLVTCHPFVIGEITCGRLRNRREVLGLLAALPGASVLANDEALAFLDARALAASGIGWIDVHLLGSAVLDGSRLWIARPATPQPPSTFRASQNARRYAPISRDH